MPQRKGKKAAFQPKDMVLAKMTGFPAWPSFVMPDDMIPSAIMRAKKKTTNLCVIFIPDGDYNWMNEKSLELLSPEKLQAKLSKLPKDKLRNKAKKKTGRTSNVADALVAASTLNFDQFMEDLAEQNKALEDENVESNEEEEEEEEEIEDDQSAEGEAEDEQIDDDSVASDHAEPINDNGLDPQQQEPTPADEVKDEPSDEESEESVSKKRATNGTGARKRRASNGDHKVAKNGTLSSPKPASEKDRQHQLWLCRIKLQRSLIQRNQPVTPKDPKDYPAPTVDELLVARIILHRLADFPVSVELLRETKIHKVLKCILKDEDLEYPDSFRLHEKCEELLLKWNPLIESLKQEKQAKLESRLSSQIPEDADMRHDTKATSSRALEHSASL